jgi:predicted 3-demethylubiquinone-9 3-methyltransferase (glyoxalase superfamily)
VFPNSRIEDLNRSGDAGPGEPGSVLSGTCQDSFGLSWQVIPERPYDLLSPPDPADAAAATQAMLGMRKIILADVESAAASV